MSEMRREERSRGRGRCGRRSGCSCILMSTAPDCRVKTRRDFWDTADGGETAEVGRRRPNGSWAGRMMLEILHVNQSALVVVLDIVRF